MRLTLFVLCLVTVLPAVHAQHKKTIELKNEKFSYSPRQFYISKVVNDLKKGEFAGWMNEDHLEFKNGAATSFSTFIANNVRQNKSAQPIVLHITKLYCEITQKKGQWKINTEMGLAFYTGDAALVEFTGSGNARTGSDPIGYLSTLLKKALANDFKQFDDWWIENKGHVALSSNVKVNVSLARNSEKEDQIVYSAQQPLQINDFQGPHGSNPSEAAATVSGIGIRYHGETLNSQLVIDVTISPYFRTSLSWFRKTEQNQRVLAHEQTHFDITALYACKLYNAVRAAKLTKENYDRVLENLQKQNEEDAEKEEILYDHETNHGTINNTQEAWQKKLKEEIRACGCY